MRKFKAVEAVQSICFDIAPAEVVGFLGPNGAGKTTTLKMLSGLLHPTSSRATVLGYTPWERRADDLRAMTLVMGQRNRNSWDIPAADSFLLNQAIYRLSDADFKSALDELDELLELGEIIRKPVRNLSLGERMKCELAAGLLHRPKVLFLDEPTIGLDITAQARIRGFLQEYNRRTGAVKCIRQEPSMLRIHQRLWQVNWAEQWQYRANLIMYLLYWLVSPVVYLSVWTAVATAQGDVQGLTANDFVLYYLTLLIVDQLTSEITIHIFGYKVQDGSLSSELIRPIHPILTNTLVYNLAFKVLVLGGMLPVWGVLWFLFQPDFGTVTWGNIALAAPAVLLGFALNFLIGASLTCLAFWTTRVWSLAEFYWASVSLFSGQFAPLMLLPTAVQTIAAFLPFQLFRYFPIQIVLGRLTPGEIVQGYVVDGVWLLVAIVLFNWVWREGVKRYSAVAA